MPYRHIMHVMRENSSATTKERMLDIQQHCHSLFERSPQPIAAVEGESYLVRFANPAFGKLVGKPAQEMIGRGFCEVVPAGGGQECLGLLERIYHSGQPEVLAEQEHTQKSRVYWTYTASPILDAEDHPIGVILQITDVTEIVEFRQQIKAMNESLLVSSVRQHEMTEEAERLNQRLQAAIKKDYFMAVISHELRTPLTPVLAGVSMLQQKKLLDDETRETLEMVLENIALEVRLIDDLLDMTRIEQGKLHLEKHPIDLAAVIKRAIGVCKHGIDARELKLNTDFGGEFFTVEADAGRLEQVFWNLLRNSIKFTPPGGRIDVRCRRSGSKVIAEIADTGIGIDAEILPRVFDAFEQGTKTQARKFGGLGLGLAITKTLVQMHGGNISAHSEGRNQGATFSVELPLAAEAAGDRANKDDGRKKERQPVRPLRILLVEDHADTGRTLRRLLTSEHHTVELAPDMSTALRLAREHPFDLILSDIGLPDGLGTELMRQLRQLGVNVPGIVLSGYGEEKDIAESHSAGFAVHLTKPATLAELHKAIESLFAAG